MKKTLFFVVLAAVFFAALSFSASATTFPTDLTRPFEEGGVSWDPETSVLAMNDAWLVLPEGVRFPGNVTVQVTGNNYVTGLFSAEGTVTVAGTGSLICENGSSPFFDAARVLYPSFLLCNSEGDFVSSPEGLTMMEFIRGYTLSLDSAQDYEYYVGDFYMSLYDEEPALKKSLLVIPGDYVDISFTPREGFVFEQWRPDGDDLGIVDTREPSLRLRMPERNVTLLVETSPIEYHFTVEAGRGGTVRVENREPDEEGRYTFYVTDRPEIVALPSDSHVFVAWSATDGAELDDFKSEETYIIVPACDFVLKAQFASSIRKLTIAPGVGGSVNPAPGEYDAGVDSILDFTATPMEGWAFSHWECTSSDGMFSAPESERTSFTMPDRDCTVTAVFLKGGYRLTSVSGVGGKLIVPEGIYEMGVIVPVRAEPDAGYHFVRWEANVEGVVNSPTLAETQVTMPAQSVSLRAVFALDVGGGNEEPEPSVSVPPDDSDLEQPFPWVALIVIFAVSAVVVALFVIRDRAGVSYRYLIRRLFRRE